MKQAKIIVHLQQNRSVFQSLLTDLKEEEYRWKPLPDKWCILEIVCHLYDEEREDFRTRVKHVLETPEQSMTSINPPAWVTERKYLEQDYAEMLDKFLEERQKSINWLKSLNSPAWQNTYQHPQLGSMTADLFLANWLAHDYLHIRQIIHRKFTFLQQYLSNESLDYAGDW